MPRIKMMTTAGLKITPRPVKFDFSQSKIHWIPNDPFSSHIFNAINILLPAGEFWFCRVFNKAIPLIKDEKLKDDVVGFVRQEAIHARAHIVGQDYLKQHNYEIDSSIQIAETIFGKLLSDRPFESSLFNHKRIESYWLLTRVGIIAAIEHFTGVIGQWTLDNKSWEENNADPEMSDLFRWHLAEEVEHRNVAFDLFHHLYQNEFGFYISRQALMVAVFPIFLFLMAEIGKSLARQDSLADMQKLGKANIFRMLFELQRTGRRTGNIPTFTFLAKSVLRWVSPKYHPEEEGDTAQALAYFAQSPAVQKAAQSQLRFS